METLWFGYRNIECADVHPQLIFFQSSIVHRVPKVLPFHLPIAPVRNLKMSTTLSVTELVDGTLETEYPSKFQTLTF